MRCAFTCSGFRREAERGCAKRSKSLGGASTSPTRKGSAVSSAGLGQSFNRGQVSTPDRASSQQATAAEGTKGPTRQSLGSTRFRLEPQPESDVVADASASRNWCNFRLRSWRGGCSGRSRADHAEYSHASAHAQQHCLLANTGARRTTPSLLGRNMGPVEPHARKPEHTITCTRHPRTHARADRPGITWCTRSRW